jgi:hypothetical protein
MTTKSKIAAPFLFTLAALATTASFAGRPLAVDDANTDDAGTGHVEAWYARQPSSTDTYTIAPAYGIVDGIELDAAISRDQTNNLNTTMVQAKFRLTAPKKDGCNVAATVGMQQPDNGTGSTPYLNGILTCNMDDTGSVHVNLGANRAPGGPTLNTWGLAFEREFGSLTGHAEYFGQERGAPTFQLGLRTMVLKNLQVDGSIGTTGGETLYSVGVKFMF